LSILSYPISRFGCQGTYAGLLQQVADAAQLAKLLAMENPSSEVNQDVIQGWND
jgi:hypothetical protein